MSRKEKKGAARKKAQEKRSKRAQKVEPEQERIKNLKFEVDEKVIVQNEKNIKFYNRFNRNKVRKKK